MFQINIVEIVLLLIIVAYFMMNEAIKSIDEMYGNEELGEKQGKI